MGHTNQEDPNKPNEIEGDRFLSSNRATAVLVYIENKHLVSGRVLVSEGFGQHYPIGAFDDPDGRIQNRRVEIYIAKNEAVKYNIEEIYQNIDNSSGASNESPKKPKEVEEAV